MPAIKQNPNINGTQSSSLTARPWGERGTAGVSFAADLMVDSLYFAFDRCRNTIKNMTFSVPAGEIVCLVGSSGSGKTALLRLIAGIERPDAGAILIGGKCVATKASFLPAEQRGIGFVFQEYALFPHLSVLQNVMFGLKTLNPHERRQVATRALERVGLSGLGDSFVYRISGGEQQRVALARAIAPRPPILLMDEPFGGLDPALRGEVRNETLAVLRETRATSIIVTHDPQEALCIADRIIFVDAGHLVEIGTPREIYRAPSHLKTARFFGEINLIHCGVANGNALTPFGSMPVPQSVLPDASREILLGLRPEALSLDPPDDSAQDQIEGKKSVVLRSRFLGHRALCEVMIASMDKPLLVAARPDNLPADGQEVRLHHARTQEALFFPPMQSA